MAMHLATKPASVHCRLALAALAAALCGWPSTASAQKWHDDGFSFRRVVQVNAAASSFPEVAVCQFFAHGAINAEKPQVAVYGRRDRVPCEVLQTGPGDFCRVALQTTSGETRYSIYYGGQGKSAETPPKWTARNGLMLETRRWKNCDAGNLDSVRTAFDTSQRIGADYVPQVFHRFDPFSGVSAPFLSRYTGTLQFPQSGKYSFFTSSQDCSFLLIDGKQVVSAPGHHGPQNVARWKGEVTLQAGPHQFEYHHAAAGGEACMVAAWQVPGVAAPAPIEASAFGSDRVAHLPANELEHREQGLLPDFQVAITGDLPSSEDDSALVRAQFINTTPATIAANGRFTWNFGDGQTSDQEKPAHVYLHPGLYQIELQVTRGQRTPSIRSAVYIPRQFVLDPKDLGQAQSLADYLPALDKYDAAKLDPAGSQRIVSIYLEADQKEKAVAAAKAAFSANANQNDESRWAIVSRIGPLLRFEMNQAREAGEMWYSASRQIGRKAWRAACAVQAADILINDLLAANKAKPVLDAAKEDIADASAEAKSQYFRVMADYFARTGERENARSALKNAVATRQLSYSATERDAWRGAHSRSAEAFLRSQEPVRARMEIERWQADFPGDKAEGYLSLLLMRYWLAAKKAEQAIATASDLLTLNHESAYADQILLLSADCEEQLGRRERAIATLQSLITDYPGSPLKDRAKDQIRQWQASTEAAKKPPESGSTAPKPPDSKESQPK
jgi:hypothetical protein